MTIYHWIRTEYDDGRVIWAPDNTEVNSWIKHPNATINQYEDPEDTSRVASRKSTRRRPSQQPGTSSSHSQPDQSNPT